MSKRSCGCDQLDDQRPWYEGQDANTRRGADLGTTRGPKAYELLAGHRWSHDVDCQRRVKNSYSRIAAKQIDSHPRVGHNDESGRFEKGEMKWQA